MGTQFQHWLRTKSAQPFHIFSGLIRGGLIFLLGYVTIFISNHHMKPSMQQELTALAGILICLIGGIFWLKNYLTIIMVKIFLKPDNPGEKES